MGLNSTSNFKLDMNNASTESSSQKTIFSTTEPYKNRIVVMKKDTWEDKILNLYGNNDDGRYGNSHPEMEPLIREVEESVFAPFLILRDTKLSSEDEDGKQEWIISPNREQYYGFYFDSTDGKMRFIKTIVEYQSDGIGEIVTTHKFSDTKRIQEEGGFLYDARRKKN